MWGLIWQTKFWPQMWIQSDIYLFHIPIQCFSNLLMLMKYMLNLNCNKSCGCDGLSPRPIKDSADILCVPFCTIFNMSFEQGIFPSLMKVAKVIPIFKKGNKQFFSNYSQCHYYLYFLNC